MKSQSDANANDKSVDPLLLLLLLLEELAQLLS